MTGAPVVCGIRKHNALICFVLSRVSKMLWQSNSLFALDFYSINLCTCKWRPLNKFYFFNLPKVSFSVNQTLFLVALKPTSLACVFAGHCEDTHTAKARIQIDFTLATFRTLGPPYNKRKRELLQSDLLCEWANEFKSFVSFYIVFADFFDCRSRSLGSGQLLRPEKFHLYLRKY